MPDAPTTVPRGTLKHPTASPLFHATAEYRHCEDDRQRRKRQPQPAEASETDYFCLSTYLKDYYSKYRYYPKTDLNFYKYGRLLGKGAFGKVNIALHLASGRLVAIKSFNKKKLTTRRARRKIKTEIEVLCKLRSPFCTQIYDYFETDTHILIVMEYICGDLLGFMRKRSKISEPTAKIIFKQIIKGLK